ncbi:MAG: hypothetical protein QOE77_2666 [Blastocatellia bacterium]|nr:hypothetical protein [Blastocatellia bacterium]
MQIEDESAGCLIIRNPNPRSEIDKARPLPQAVLTCRMQPDSLSNNRKFASLLLLLLPALLIVVAFQIRTASGPYWFSENLDPSYAYLLNSLNISNLHRPNHIDHPGTPVQTLGAVIIRILNPTADESSRAREVLKNPDVYLRTINNVFIFIAAFCLLVAGIVVFRVTGQLVSALLLQGAPFLSATMMQGLFGVRPEPLFVSLSIIFSVLILLSLTSHASTRTRALSIAFGVLAGLGMAAKINFLPLLLIPLVILSSWKWRIIYAVTAGLSFFFFILPILAPSHLMRFFGFAVGISTHTGRYGTGPAGIVNPREFVRNALSLMATDWLFFLIIAASVVLLLAKFGRTRLSGGRYRVLLAVTLAQVVEFVLVAKHPSSHYLMPALGLVGVNLIVIAQLWRETTFSARIRNVALAAICLVLLLVQVIALREQQAEMRTLAARQRGAAEKIQNEFRNVPVVDYYSASSPAYALKFGVEYSGNLYVSIMDELYPGSLFYNPWTQQFSNFAGPIDPGGLRGTPDGFLMHGYSLKDSDFAKFLPPHAFPDDLTLEPVYGGTTDVPGVYDGETVYRAKFGK